jgi:hypothetical protein
MITLPDDTIYNIMLNAHIDDIPYICNSNKHSHNYYNDLFWKNKFEHDNLPIYIYRKYNDNKKMGNII